MPAIVISIVVYAMLTMLHCANRYLKKQRNLSFSDQLDILHSNYLLSEYQISVNHFRWDKF